MACSSISRSCLPQVRRNMQVTRFSPRWSRAPSIMLSITVIRLSALVSWKVRTMPARATDDAEVLSSLRPSKDQCAPVLAEDGLSKPVIRLKNVVLPAPLGPISEVMMPRCTSRWSTSTAVMPPKLRMMLSTSRIGSGLAAPGSASTPASAPPGPPGRPAGTAYRRSSAQTLNRSSLLSPRIPCGRKITSSISATPMQIQENCCGLLGVHDRCRARSRRTSPG